MNAKPLPSLEYLNECFILDTTCPSGLRWKKRPREHFSTYRGWLTFTSIFAGTPAGHLWTSPRGQAYYVVRIMYKNKSKSYKLHRIIYSIHHEFQLSSDIEIDHKDTDSLNNSICNLRLATNYQNSHNVNLGKNNTSGFKGVNYSTTGKYWQGRILYKGNNYTIRGCPTPEKAHELLCELRQNLLKEFTNHGS